MEIVCLSSPTAPLSTERLLMNVMDKKIDKLTEKEGVASGGSSALPSSEGNEWNLDDEVYKIKCLDDFKKMREEHAFSERDLITVIEHYAGGRETTNYILGEGKINPILTLETCTNEYWDVLSLELVEQSFRACVPWQRRYILHEYLIYAFGIYGDDSPNVKDLMENKEMKANLDGMIGCKIGKLTKDEMKFFRERYCPQLRCERRCWSREKFFRSEEEAMMEALEKSDTKTVLKIMVKAMKESKRYRDDTQISRDILASWGKR